MKAKFLFLLLALGLIAASPAKNGYEVGDSATDFKLKNVDGRMVALADWKDAKGYIVVFDCNTCPVSKAYNDRIIKLSKKYASKGFPLVAINSNEHSESSGDSFDDMVSYAKSHKYDFPYLIDETQQVAKSYGATNTPHIFILTKSGGSLKVAYIGAIDDSARNEAGATKHYVEDAVDALLAGKPVTVSKTKAIGCGIKFKES